jgi:hypothetical protein
MAVDLRKFVNPRFIRTVDPELLARLLERHREATRGLEASPSGIAFEALQAFFAGPEARYPEGLVVDLHRVAELGNAEGLRLILDQALRLGIALRPERDADGGERRQDPKHVALRTFLDHPAVFDAASDMLALAVRSSSLVEYAGVEPGIEADLGEAARASFAAEVTAMLEAAFCGSYCRLGWYADADDVNLVVSHGSIVRTAPIVKGDEERVVSYRDAEQAVVSYCAATGRLKLGDIPKARCAEVADLFARCMLGRPGFFAAEGAQDLYTLAPIERDGTGFRFRTGFDDGIREVQIVEAQAARVDDGARRGRGFGGSRLLARDARCCALARLDEVMRGGRLGQDWRLEHVVLRIAFDCGAERPAQVTAKIRPPSTAAFPRHRFEGRVLKLLHRNGLVSDRVADRTAAATV